MVHALSTHYGFASLKQDDLGYAQDNLRYVVITETCFAFLLSTVSVALQLWVRKITRTGLFLDDYLILESLVSPIAQHEEASY